MLITTIRQKRGKVEVDVKITYDESDERMHSLEIATDGAFHWGGSVKANATCAEALADTALANDSTKVIVKWDNAVIREEKLNNTGPAPRISATYSVQ
ncbi:MAG: hypothetical protein PHV33_12915 [Elusimicrobiales bacterium]|nr:hypothetical protein [Elusimicrobiales bacterium]